VPIVDTSTVTIGEFCDAIAAELCQGNPMRPDQIDYDTTVINLATTVFDLAQTFGKVARRIGWLSPA
jgi:hypothetical protein